MSIQELLNIADQIVSESTGRHLTDLQSDLLIASCENQTYEQFANNHGYCFDYVKKDVGCALWNLLSEALGEKVTKKNFRQALARCQDSKKISKSYTKSQRRDCNAAPDVETFFGRTEELDTLKQWILQDKCRLIALLGVGGIGKTALAVKLIEQNQDEFDYVIWRSLRHAQPLASLLDELVSFLSQQQKTKTQMIDLLECLRSSRCLVILDNFETILQPKKLAGEYHEGYEDYGELLNLLGESFHQSTFILTSREKPLEISEAECRELSVRSLQINGSLKIAQPLIQQQGLSGSDDQKQKLCWYYGCNPLALKIACAAIHELFNGEISHFLEHKAIFFSGIRRLMGQHFSRLSPLEKRIMYSLAIHREWVTISELIENIMPLVSQTILLEALESLCRRSLIRNEAGKYTQQYMMMEYVSEHLTENYPNNYLLHNHSQISRKLEGSQAVHLSVE